MISKMDEFRENREIRDSVDRQSKEILEKSVSESKKSFLTKHFWAELSPTPRNIFYLDFFLRKREIKLNWGKIMNFGKTFLKISKLI